jgi:hypothetical protein
MPQVDAFNAGNCSPAMRYHPPGDGQTTTEAPELSGSAGNMRVSSEVEIAFALAQREAARRRHEYVTVEHLLYALLFDEETVGILRHAGGNLTALKRRLDGFLTDEVQPLPEDADVPFPSLSFGFNRAIQRAAMHVQSSGKKELKGANVLIALFAERDCPAVAMLGEHGVTRFDVVNYVSHGVSRIGANDVGREKHGDAGLRTPPTPEPTSKLSGAEVLQLYEALLDAVHSRSALAGMVRSGLDEDLYAIVPPDSLEGPVLALIRWAEARGRLDELLRAAEGENPGNAKLRAFIEGRGKQKSV